MTNILIVLQIIVSIILIILILIQKKGTGLSTAFGGQGGFYRSRRGVEKMVSFATIAAAVLFFLLSVILVAAR